MSIEILQELTLERIAFDAKMVITNNVPDKDLTNIRVDVTIQDAAGNVKNDIFFVKVASTNNIGAVDGTGVVMRSTTAEAHWLIIPSPGAGGADPAGISYWVGATLTYIVAGVQETVTVNPDRIIVKPEPQLVLDYFMPFEVLGDNPFTPQVEAPIPFPLAVRVLNEGFGPANSLKIDSAQPKIVDNAQGLLVNFQLIGASVNDSAVSPSLTVNIGTLESKKIATAYWEMISTLSGHFVEFNATFSHASELGGELTSLLKETNTHYLIHRVKDNLAGRDGRLDFLADTDRDAEHLPDALFESEIPGGTGKTEDARLPVAVVPVTMNPARPTSASPEVQLGIQTGQSGWIYTKLSDPSQGLLKLLDVVRADGVHLDPNNFWVQEGLDQNYQTIFTLHILDYRASGGTTGTYTLVFTKPAEDTVPPSTSLLFDGPSKGTDPVYITPATRIIYISRDNDGGSGVDRMYRKIIGEDTDYVPAYPMNIDAPGSVELEYYSVDSAGNSEAVKTAHLYVDDVAPDILSFDATPSTIMPHAPAGVAAERTTNFVVNASDDSPNLQAVLDIASGTTFSDAGIIRTINVTVVPSAQTETKIFWDGKDTNGALVPTGVYTARLKLTDGLDSSAASHTSTSTVAVTVAEWFKGEPLDPNVTSAQQYPDVSGTRVVWQDQRSGSWDIYLKEIAGGSSSAITDYPSDQTRPAISGNIIVWQDRRSGAWDIYGYDASTGQEFVVCNDAGNQEMPVISGAWVAWQDDRNGNYDIYLYDLNTHEQTRITNHERDQMHPALSGNILAWEDYRHGLGEIYTYDLVEKTEQRHTVNIYNQTLPAVSGGTIVWTDQRNDQRDIYLSAALNSETRVTYGAGDHSQAAVLDNVIVYTDYEAGYSDPNLAFFDLISGVGATLTAHSARQEEPVLGAGVLVWQDDRDGISQIYWTNFSVEALPIEAEIKPGFNLIAVGDKLATSYPTADALIAANPAGSGIERIVAYSGLNGMFVDSSIDGSFSLRKGMAIGVYAAGSGVIGIGESGEAGLYTLYPGLNYIGMLTAPNGYTAYSLLASIGFENVQSVRRFNSRTGSWESASLREDQNGTTPVGVDFAIHQGEGLIITMKNRVDGWRP